MERVVGKVCLVTGGARGIGLAAAEALLAEGAKVMITDVDAQAGTAVASRLGRNACFRDLDVSSAVQWEEALDALEAMWGPVSDESSYITGSDLLVDGGFTAS